jgi:hypothetical protein
VQLPRWRSPAGNVGTSGSGGLALHLSSKAALTTPSAKTCIAAATLVVR